MNEDIVLSSIKKSFGDKVIFDGFSLTLPAKKISCVLGASGAGKSTLLNIVAHATEYSGSVSGRGEVSYVFQRERLVETLSIRKNLELVLYSVIKNADERAKRIRGVLETVELWNERDKRPSELSGGQAQRAAMARAFVYPSDVLLMDEPFKALDTLLKARLIDAFLKLFEQDRRTVVFVTHAIDEALLLADDVYVLGGTPATVTHTVHIPSPQQTRKITDSDLEAVRADLLAALISAQC